LRLADVRGDLEFVHEGGAALQGEVLNIARFREDVVNINVFAQLSSDELTEVTEQGLPEGVFLQPLVAHLGRLDR